ncbi:MAG: leucyl/phenylalanyl-tRNA--protein transferase [Neisseria sp.]|nr:leucyl/phenylalanyl-tRNA--protein transferase [Neisseria sp.]
MQIPFLAPGDYRFPSPARALCEADGLVGISRDLDAARLLSAYRQGIFPWYEQDGFFFWFAVAPRAVLLPENLHIGRSLAKTLRNKPYLVSANRDFAQVIASCSHAARPGQDGTWITPAFREAYTRLHHMGCAHSFECYYPATDGQMALAGGFYGVQIGRVFYGESMFARQADASKIAFACAVPHLAACGISLIDCQQDTAHLKRFGSHTMAFGDFQAALQTLNGLPPARPLETGIVASTL